MINKAHDDWVTGLVLIPGTFYLLSCCRSGMLKVWNVDNCSLVGDVHAHNSPINALAANSQLLFAASKYELSPLNSLPPPSRLCFCRFLLVCLFVCVSER